MEPYRSTLHAANPSAAFIINRYCVPGTLRRGLRNVLRYGGAYWDRTSRAIKTADLQSTASPLMLPLQETLSCF